MRTDPATLWSAVELLVGLCVMADMVSVAVAVYGIGFLFLRDADVNV